MAQEKHVKPFNIDNLDVEDDNENLESINEAMNQLRFFQLLFPNFAVLRLKITPRKF